MGGSIPSRTRRISTIPQGCVAVRLETSASQPISRQPARACRIGQPQPAGADAAADLRQPRPHRRQPGQALTPIGVTASIAGTTPGANRLGGHDSCVCQPISQRTDLGSVASTVWLTRGGDGSGLSGLPALVGRPLEGAASQYRPDREPPAPGSTGPFGAIFLPNGLGSPSGQPAGRAWRSGRSCSWAPLPNGGTRERLGPDDVRVSRVRREFLGPRRSLRTLRRPMRIRFVTDLPQVH